jgi:hypothetical protein
LKISEKVSERTASAAEIVYLVIYTTTLVKLLIDVCLELFSNDFSESSVVTLGVTLIAVFIILRAYQSLEHDSPSAQLLRARPNSWLRGLAKSERAIKIILAVVIISGLEATPLRVHSAFEYLWTWINLLVYQFANFITTTWHLTLSILTPLSATPVGLLGPLIVELGIIFILLIAIETLRLVLTGTVICSRFSRARKPSTFKLTLAFYHSVKRAANAKSVASRLHELWFGLFFSLFLLASLSYQYSLILVITCSAFAMLYVVHAVRASSHRELCRLYVHSFRTYFA